MKNSKKDPKSADILDYGLYEVTDEILKRVVIFPRPGRLTHKLQVTTYKLQPCGSTS